MRSKQVFFRTKDLSRNWNSVLHRTGFLWAKERWSITLKKLFSMGANIDSYSGFYTDYWFCLQKVHIHQSCDQDVCSPADCSSNCLKQLSSCPVQRFWLRPNKRSREVSLQWPFWLCFKMAPVMSIFHNDVKLEDLYTVGENIKCAVTIENIMESFSNKNSNTIWSTRKKLCYPKIRLFDIKIILNWRQLRSSKPRKSPLFLSKGRI